MYLNRFLSDPPHRICRPLWMHSPAAEDRMERKKAEAHRRPARNNRVISFGLPCELPHFSFDDQKSVWTLGVVPAGCLRAARKICAYTHGKAWIRPNFLRAIACMLGTKLPMSTILCSHKILFWSTPVLIAGRAALVLLYPANAIWAASFVLPRRALRANGEKLSDWTCVLKTELGSLSATCSLKDCVVP